MEETGEENIPNGLERLKTRVSESESKSKSESERDSCSTIRYLLPAPALQRQDQGGIPANNLSEVGVGWSGKLTFSLIKVIGKTNVERYNYG